MIGTIIVPMDKERITVNDLIFLNKERTKELSFQEWFEEQNIEIIIRDKVLNED